MSEQRILRQCCVCKRIYVRAGDTPGAAFDADVGGRWRAIGIPEELEPFLRKSHTYCPDCFEKTERAMGE